MLLRVTAWNQRVITRANFPRCLRTTQSIQLWLQVCAAQQVCKKITSKLHTAFYYMHNGHSFHQHHTHLNISNTIMHSCRMPSHTISSCYAPLKLGTTVFTNHGIRRLAAEFVVLLLKNSRDSEFYLFFCRNCAISENSLPSKCIYLAV